MPALLPGCPLPWGVQFPCSGRYSSSLEDPRFERKDSFLESFCDPDLVVLVRSIGVCRKCTRRLDCLGVTGIDVFCFRRQKLFLPRCVTGGYMAYGNPRWARKQKTTCPALGRLWEVYGEATGNHPTHGAHRNHGAYGNHRNHNCLTMDACSSFN